MSPLAPTPSSPAASPFQAAWRGEPHWLHHQPQHWHRSLARLDRPVFVVASDPGPRITHRGQAAWSDSTLEAPGLPLIAFAGPLTPDRLGDETFRTAHGVRLAYMTGSMANGIASAALVIAAGRAGLLSSYGAAGQRVEAIAQALDQIEAALGPHAPFASNLIHSPNEPAHEMAVVDLYLRRGLRLVEASAYLDLTLPVVRYRLAGIHRRADGSIVTPHRVIAKASRIEVASKWFAPPPARFIAELLARGDLTPEQAELARSVPMAQDLTAEADSGGHTDNRPLVTLLPSFLALRDRAAREHGWDACDHRLRVGAAGGLATPAATAAAFALGADYLVTGSVNQACVESGSSDAVRLMLAQAQQADVIMAPAADMFELGVKLQVLKRGTLFAMRAQKLYELYRAHPSIDALPAAERAAIEKTIFRMPLEEVWALTRDYFNQYDPQQVAKAQSDPRHRMALTFRWYLGLSSRWANAGVPDRQIDYQVWCGPAMGAFNEWTRDSFLADPAQRTVAAVALNLMHGAAYNTRAQQLRRQGATLPPGAADFLPTPLASLQSPEPDE